MMYFISFYYKNKNNRKKIFSVRLDRTFGKVVSGNKIILAVPQGYNVSVCVYNIRISANISSWYGYISKNFPKMLLQYFYIPVEK